MEKTKRNTRIAAIIRILCQYPNRLFTLSYFCEMFGSAKSTISEDIVLARATLNKYDLGDLVAVTGASGGVKYVPTQSRGASLALVAEICTLLEDPQRLLPGGYVYTVDIVSNPLYIESLGNILAAPFLNSGIDLVATVETKGIPIALMVARALGVPFVIMRRENKLTEGSVMTINYISGSSKRLQAMSLSTRAVKKGQRALIVDDFMKGGGTAKAIADLLREFEVEVVGTGVLFATKEPKEKNVGSYTSLIELHEPQAPSKAICCEPTEWLRRG